MAIIGIGICISENLQLGIGIGLVGIFLYCTSYTGGFLSYGCLFTLW